ncbi:TerD family protein [Fibrella aestuarina]|nr:TerD family protein [Fibrella aestuarina]
MYKLEKGENIALLKEGDAGAEKIKIGLGWKEGAFDIDVYGLVVNASDSKGLTLENTYYFGNVDGKGTSSNTAYGGILVNQQAVNDRILQTQPIAITKDNLTGKGAGDDEVLYINANNLPKDKKIIVALIIYKAAERRQNFGQVEDAYCRFPGDGEDIQYDLAEEFSKQTGVVMCEFYWKGDQLKGKAIGRGFIGDLNTIAADYR